MFSGELHHSDRAKTCQSMGGTRRRTGVISRAKSVGSIREDPQNSAVPEILMGVSSEFVTEIF